MDYYISKYISARNDIPIENNIKIYFLNTEQLSLEHHFDYVKSLPKYIKIIDYSLGNFFLINQLKRTSYCLPYTF